VIRRKAADLGVGGEERGQIEYLVDHLGHEMRWMIGGQQSRRDGSIRNDWSWSDPERLVDRNISPRPRRHRFRRIGLEQLISARHRTYTHSLADHSPQPCERHTRNRGLLTQAPEHQPGASAWPGEL